jgi:hypothetical protein
VNIKKYCALVVCVVLLFAHTQVKSMDYCWLNRTFIASIVVSGVVCIGFLDCFLKKLKTPEQEMTEEVEVEDDDNSFITETVDLTGKNIDRIELGGVGNLYITQVCKGEKEHFSVTMAKKYRNLLQQAGSGDNFFSIGFSEQPSIDDNYYVECHIALRKISHIVLDGEMEAQCATNIISPRLNIELTGSAAIFSLGHELYVQSLSATCSEDSFMALAGTASFQDLIFSGNAQYNALRLKSHDVRIVACDSSEIALCVEHHDNNKGRRLQSTVFCVLSGNSTVRYQGNPRIAQSWCAGQASIERIAQ